MKRPVLIDRPQWVSRQCFGRKRLILQARNVTPGYDLGGYIYSSPILRIVARLSSNSIIFHLLGGQIWIYRVDWPMLPGNEAWPRPKKGYGRWPETIATSPL